MSLQMWCDAIRWMDKSVKQLTVDWPEEFPPESDKDFWTIACQMEMKNRAVMTQKTRRLVSTGRPDQIMTVLEQWYYRRRVEFAVQLCIAGVQREVHNPKASLRELLHYLLVESWDDSGCIAMWNHAIERGGQPHPENPDGLTPLG